MKVADASEAISLLRKKFKLSQASLAKELNVSHTTISLWERGKANMNVHNAYKMYKKFDIVVESIFESEEDIKGYEEWHLK